VVDFLRAWDPDLGWWDLVGFFGQALFFSRFIVQWVASERKKESVVPVSFWWLSIFGSLICLVYAVHTRRLPFIMGYTFNCIPYVRNLVLIARKRQEKPA
jgi:lipid-A-disaccharide synthase-like uncharacterized protein